MKESLKRKADVMCDVYSQLYKKYKWKANDVALRFAACVYSQSDKKFQIEQYDRLIKHIKKNTGLFSYFRATLLYSTAAQLICQFDQPEQAFLDLLGCDQILKENGFKATSYRGIAAYALLLTCSEEVTEPRVRKALAIYKRMKDKHYWLTTTDDYGIAVLLAAEKEDQDNLIARIEANYQRLNQEGFGKSNGLQFLSHLLTFSPEPATELARRAKEVADFLKANKLKVSSMYYGAIGLLVLLGQDCNKALTDLVEMVDYLKANKAFKWYYKEINVLMISALVGSEYVEELKQKNLGTTSIGIAIEALIAAQTAAMIASVTAATAAASAGSSAH